MAPDSNSNDPLQTTHHVARAVAGDAEALAAVIERFTPVMLAQARHRMGARLLSEADPEDVVSDVWLTVLPRLAEIGSNSTRRTPVLLRFLSSAVLNRVNNLLTRSLRRGRSREYMLDASEPSFEVSAQITNAVSACARKEHAARIQAEIDALPDSDRAILVLRGIEQRSNSEAAELLGLEGNTAAVRYRRALERLRAALPGSLFDEFA